MCAYSASPGKSAGNSAILLKPASSYSNVLPDSAETLFRPLSRASCNILPVSAYVDKSPNSKDCSCRRGQLRLHPFKFLAIDGSVDYRKTDISSTTVRTFPVQGSALIYPFGTKRLSPFILGGASWYFTHVEGPHGFDKTQHRFGAHVGAGLQLFLSEHLSLDSTYRHIWLEKIESKDASLQDKQFQDNGHMVTFGLNLHF